MKLTGVNKSSPGLLFVSNSLLGSQVIKLAAELTVAVLKGGSQNLTAVTPALRSCMLLGFVRALPDESCMLSSASLQLALIALH